MSQSLQASPMVRAQELVRVSLSSATIEELIEHRDEVMRTLLELAGVRVVAHGMSANAMANVRHIEQKLLAHLQLLQELIEDRQAALAAQQANDQATAPAEVRTSIQLGRSLQFSRSRSTDSGGLAR